MDLTQLQPTLDNLLITIKKDVSLNEEIREALSELIMNVSAEPTPENLDALVIVLNKTSSTQSYMAAMTELQNLQVDKIMEL